MRYSKGAVGLTWIVAITSFCVLLTGMSLWSSPTGPSVAEISVNLPDTNRAILLKIDEIPVPSSVFQSLPFGVRFSLAFAGIASFMTFLIFMICSGSPRLSASTLLKYLESSVNRKQFFIRFLCLIQLWMLALTVIHMASSSGREIIDEDRKIQYLGRVQNELRDRLPSVKDGAARNALVARLDNQHTLIKKTRWYMVPKRELNILGQQIPLDVIILLFFAMPSLVLFRQWLKGQLEL